MIFIIIIIVLLAYIWMKCGITKELFLSYMDNKSLPFAKTLIISNVITILIITLISSIYLGYLFKTDKPGSGMGMALAIFTPVILSFLAGYCSFYLIGIKSILLFICFNFFNISIINGFIKYGVLTILDVLFLFYLFILLLNDD